MSFTKAKQAFQDNARRYLTAKDGHLWNTNAGLLNLCEAMDAEIGDLHSKLHKLEQRLQRLELSQRR